MLTVYRKEIKYVIPVEEYLRIRMALEALMVRDKNGNHGMYEVRSQYYDSLHNRDLSDNLSGLMEKRKIRIRVYSPDDASAKLEYKCKSNQDGVKRSMIISRQEAMQMEHHQYAFLLEREEELAKQLYSRIMQGCYQPKTIITYQRTAYAYPASDLRITFDTELRGSVNPYGLFEKDLAQAPLLHPGLGVLEIKYNDYIPSPIKNIVERIDRLSEASSKYSQSRLQFVF